MKDKEGICKEACRRAIKHLKEWVILSRTRSPTYQGS